MALLEKSKQTRKKSFDERLSPWEQKIKNVPTWPLIASTAVLIVIASFWADKETNLSSWHPSIREVTAKTLKVLIDSSETIAIVAAVVLYYKEAPARKDQRHYEAWQVIDNADGVQTSYARYKALQDLNDDGVSLKGLDAIGADLSNINLEGAELCGANLANANLSGAKLNGCNLSGAKLRSSVLNGAELCNANLSGVNLSYAKLSGINLSGANLHGAKLSSAKLCGASLINADMNGAWLGKASLMEADLSGADLNRANLDSANLSGADLSNAKLESAQNWTDEQLSQAKLCQTMLPEGSKLDPNQDCPK